MKRKFLVTLLLCGLSPAAFAFNLLFLRDSPVAQFTPEDTGLMVENFYYAMDENEDGEIAEWKNEETGNFGSTLPFNTTQEGDNTCRRVVIENTARDQHAKSEYKFCKAPEGKWVVAQGES